MNKIEVCSFEGIAQDVVLPHLDRWSALLLQKPNVTVGGNDMSRGTDATRKPTSDRPTPRRNEETSPSRDDPHAFHSKLGQRVEKFLEQLKSCQLSGVVGVCGEVSFFLSASLQTSSRRNRGCRGRSLSP